MRFLFLKKIVKKFSNSLLAMLLVCVFGYWSVYFFSFNGPPIRSDGFGYYSYLPSFFIHHDVGFETLMNENFQGEVPEWTGLQRHPTTNKIINRYPMGVALMSYPFFAVAEFVTYLFKYSNDGLNPIYQYSIGLAGLIYCILGLFFLKKALTACSFSRKTVNTTLWCILLGTNLFHYATYDSVFSHAFSFFLVSTLIYISLISEKISKNKLYTLLGLLAGLIFLVRNTNLYFVLIFFILSNDRKSLNLGYIRYFYISFVTGLLVVLPQLIHWKLQSGSWLLNGYANTGATFDFLNPHVFDVLFSAKKGVLFWNPLLALAMIGFFFLHKKKWELLLAMLSIFSIHLYLIASWSNWWFGGSFGHRGFVEILPLASFGLAALLEKSKRNFISIFLIALVLHNLINMYLYWTSVVPFEGVVDYQDYFNKIIFWQ